MSSRPFAEGETVSVSAGLQPGGAGGTVPVSWSFTVASRDVPGAGVGSVTPVLGAASGQSFVSRPELRPPVVTVSSSADRATGNLFLAPYAGTGQFGPMILDPQGRLIWSTRSRPERGPRTCASRATTASRCSPGGRTRWWPAPSRPPEG